ncbi:MAG: ABC transporter ATP-binding protein [Pyrobaculum sp.]|uniref:ABC transporter ATP-binding protein n=1 Tax=Pyrobaculum sp. TaxID=2004705 RepID=UPI003169A70B
MEAVRTVGLSKTYPGGVRALDGVDLEVEEGRVFAVLGPNGAGKTTLIRILTAQIRPTSGRAYVLGHDVMKEEARVREVVGYVPQEISVWTDLTGYENLLIYAKLYGADRRAVREVLDFMGLGEAADRLVRTYSGGMVRRLEIACALLKRPRVLLLDEPTVGLDPAARRLIWARLLELKKLGTTIFFSTHYMDEAEHYADEVALLNRGRVVARGPVEALRREVGGDAVIAEVDDVVKAAQLARGAGYSAVAEGDRLMVFSASPGEDLPRLLAVFIKGGVAVKRVYVKNATLDDVFMKLVGKPAEGGDLKSAKSVRKAVKRA